MPQISLDRPSGSGKPDQKKGSATTSGQQRLATNPGILIAVAAGALIVLLLGIGWSLGWFDHSAAVPRTPATAGAASTQFSEDHPMGNKRNKSMDLDGADSPLHQQK